MNPLQLVELLRGHKNYIQTHNYPDPDAVASAFGLQYFLKQLQINELEICGAQTEYCIDATVKMAHGLGYQLTMKPGASSTIDNQFMTAEETRRYFEWLWGKNFLSYC